MERFVIEREVDGKQLLFALTEHEMNKAWDMVQHKWDIEDVLAWFESALPLEDIDDYDDDAIDEIAYRKRYIQDEDGTSWFDAVESAVAEYSIEHAERFPDNHTDIEEKERQE